MVMGLLDSVMGAVGGALANQVGNSLGGALGGAGGAGSAKMVEGLVAALTSGGGQAGGGALGGLGGLGGLAGLVQQLQQGGLADQVGSWVSTGQNLPVSPEQLQGALGSDMLGQLARSVGLDAGQAVGPLAQLLPQVVDALTPDGQLPTGGADLGSLLPQVLGKLMNPSA
jgi:uncharacterized protein YidB (DUF937 family)